MSLQYYYHYKYVGSRREAEVLTEKLNKQGYIVKVTKVRDDMYEVRSYKPD